MPIGFASTPNPKGFGAGAVSLGVGPISSISVCRIGCGVRFGGKYAMVCGAEYVV